MTALDNLYKPRSDEKVIAELKAGQLPPEIAEVAGIADANSEAYQAITGKLQQIAAKVIKANGLDRESFTPNIQISTLGTHKKYRESSFTTAPFEKNPLLMLDTTLLQRCTSEDELAAIICLGLADKTMRENNSRPAQITSPTALALTVEYLHKAGFNPGAFFKKESDERLRELWQQRFTSPDKPSFEKFKARSSGVLEEVLQIFLVGKLADLNNPSDTISSIASLKPGHSSPANLIPFHDIFSNSPDTPDIIISKSKYPENFIALPDDFHTQVAALNTTHPLEKALTDIGYAAMRPEQKITTLTDYISVNWPPSNETLQKRLKLVGEHISKLEVEFTEQVQAEAFANLANLVMIDLDTKSSRVGLTSSISTDLAEALQTPWQKGHENPEEKFHVGPVLQMKQAVEQFTAAKTAVEAEQWATEILDFCKKINPSHRKVGFKGFYPPSEAEVEQALAQNGSYTPPYAQHVLWCQETKNTNTEEVLRGMGLEADPWIKTSMGSRAYNMERDYYFGLNTVPQGKDYRNYKDSHGYNRGDFKYMSKLKRDESGTVTGKQTAVEAYPWPPVTVDDTKATLKELHAQHAPKRKAYDEEMVAAADWNLLKTDFKKFVAVYGACLVPDPSLVKVEYPFAKRFFEELKNILPIASPDYKTSVSKFFWGDSVLDSNDQRHGIYEEIIGHFYPASVRKWKYANQNNSNSNGPSVPFPGIYTPDHPLMKFINSDLGKKIVSEEAASHFHEFAAKKEKPDPEQVQGGPETTRIGKKREGKR